jgi:acetoacetyl-CoA synthetase
MAPFYFTKSGSSVSPNPASEIVGMLTPIWESVLHRSSIGIDDNFFKLGGNQQTADLLFADIARKAGRELPSATVFHAPTIAALASVLEQPTLPRFSPYVQLKAGSGKLPILIAHGLNGCASFAGLAKSIPTEHPIYGIQAKGVDGLEEPFDRIEDMAQFYVDALSELQSQGPYILIGYSFGGLVALEMAQRLSGNQKRVGLLVLVDAYPHPRYLSAGQRVRLAVQRVARHISEMKQRPIRGAISYFMSGLKNRLRIAGVQRGEIPSGTSRLALAQTTLHVKDRAYVAMARYRPLAYRGEIKFVKSESDTYFPGDPVPVWAKLADTFEVVTIPGTHLNIVTTHFESLAAVLTRYLRETVR